MAQTSNSDEKEQERQLEKINKKQEARIHALETKGINLVNLYFVFQGVVLTAITTKRLDCEHWWIPFSLSLIASVVNILALFFTVNSFLKCSEELDQNREDLSAMKGRNMTNALIRAQAGQRNSEAQAGQQRPEAQAGQQPPEAQAGQQRPEAQAGQQLPEAQAGQQRPEDQAGQQPPEAQAGQQRPEAQAGQQPPNAQAVQQRPEGQAGQQPPKAQAGQQNQRPKPDSKAQCKRRVYYYSTVLAIAVFSSFILAGCHIILCPSKTPCYKVCAFTAE